MDDLRVKFYSTTDMASGIHLREAEKILEEMDSSIDVDDINDVLELYNVKKYFDAKIYLIAWDVKTKEKYINIAKTTIPKKIGIFCSKISDDNIISFVEKLHFQYDDDFWEMIENYKVYKRISDQKLREILTKEQVRLESVLKNKNIVEYYNEVVADELKRTPSNAVLLISNYLENHMSGWEPMYFPEALSKEDKTNLVREYISSENPNLNVLKLLSHSQSSDDLYLTDLMIYDAKKRYAEEVNRFFEQNTGQELLVTVSMSADIDETCVEFKGNELSATYSSNWIIENSDYATLLNNFIYLFGYTDMHFRCQMVSKAGQLNVLEQFLGLKGKKDYVVGVTFEYMDKLSILQIVQYEKLLESNSIELLKVFKWFFEEYLMEEFNVNDFELDIPSPQTTYLEKCKLLATSLDRILKQFCMYIENGKIDHELLGISSNPVLFRNITSFVPDKYVYPCDCKLKYVYNVMFSSQSTLLFASKKGSEHKSFYKYIEENNVLISEYDIYRELLEKLIEQKFLFIDSHGFIKPAIKKNSLVKDLYENEVMCYSYIKEYYAEELHELKIDGQVEFANTLFSVPEQSYLNYFLNRAEFSNGLDLRNKYVHGSHAPASAENEHIWNYYRFLRILTIVIIKINEEFCLRDERLKTDLSTDNF